MDIFSFDLKGLVDSISVVFIVILSVAICVFLSFLDHTRVHIKKVLLLFLERSSDFGNSTCR